MTKSIRIDDALHKLAKIAASYKSKSLQQFTEEALREALKHPQPKKKAKR